MHVRYGAFITAFRKLGLDHLFMSESPRIESVYLMTDSGLLVAKAEGSHFQVDPDLFTSMLSAISSFVKDSLSSEKAEGKSLNIMGYGEYRIVVEKGHGLNLVVVHTGKESRNVASETGKLLDEIESRFLSHLPGWKGDVEQFKDAEHVLKKLLTLPKYDGRHIKEERLKRDYVFDNTRTSLTNLSRDSPLILILEDLHFADHWTLALLHYLAKTCRDKRIMLVGTYMPVGEEFRSQTVVEAMHLMDFEQVYDHIHLMPLALNEMQPFVLSSLGKAEFPETFYAKLHEDSEGIPYYVLMLLRILSEDGIIQRKEDSWVLIGEMEHINRPSTWLNFLLKGKG